MTQPQPPDRQPDLHFDVSVDVIVVGAGLAGYCAAVEAAEAGAEVLLLEKQDLVGGSTVLSGGFMALAATPQQAAAGIDDSTELLLRDLRAVGGPEADEALLQAYVQEQGDLWHWLAKRGVVFGAIEHSAGQSVARSHQTDTPRLLALLGEALAANPKVRIANAAPMRSLIRGAAQRGRVAESETSTVVGVVAELDGRLQRIGARGGVVLASGGFSRSEDLLGLFAPAQCQAVRIGGAGNTGDGLRQAWKLGAGLRDMGQIRGTFGTHPDCSSERHEILLAFYVGAIIVNQAGRRFIDESLSYKQLGDAGLQQPGAQAWQVFDQQVMDRSAPGVALFDFEPALARGLLRQAPTLQELAALCSIDADGLVKTVARYNAGVQAGHDNEFGRDGLCHHAGARLMVDQPPYYGYRSTTALLATYCGLHIDAGARVRDVDGEVITGLFAAGEITGGFHGRSYMTGSSLGKAAIFGRIAGRGAVRPGRAAAA